MARADEGSGDMPPPPTLTKKFLLFRARKCHFPRFPGNSFINQNMTKRRVFSNLRRLYANLLLTGSLMRDLHRVKFTAKGETSPQIDLFSFLRHSLVTWPEMGKQTKHSR